MQKQITLLTEEGMIHGAYTAGSNSIPTIEWQNQLNPLLNAYLQNFMFEQDNGWIGDSFESYRLLLSGGQHLKLKRPIEHTGKYTVFSIDAWLTPYEMEECNLMDFIQLYSEYGTMRIKAPGLDLRSDVTLNTNETYHIVFCCNMQSKVFELWINGEEVELKKNINTDEINLPEKLTLLNGFIGTVYSIKFYRIFLTKRYIQRNFEEGPVGQRYFLANCVVCLEACKAETLNNSFKRLHASLTVMNEEILGKVSSELYEENKKIVDGKLVAYDEWIANANATFQMLKDSIKLKVDTSDFEVHKENINVQIGNLEGNLETLSVRVTLAESGIEMLRDEIKLYVKTEDYQFDKALITTIQNELLDLTIKYQSMDSSITTLRDAIKLKVDTVDYNNTITSITTKFEDLNGTLTKQIEIIKKNTADINILRDAIESTVSIKDVINEINKIEIGAKNLIQNSSFLLGKLHWSSNSSFTTNPSNGTLTMERGGTLRNALLPTIDFSENLKYVLSMNVQILDRDNNPSSDEIMIAIEHLDKKGNSVEIFSEFIEVEASATLKEIEPIKIVLEEPVRTMVKLKIVTPPGKKTTISKPMLEKGTIKTDYSMGVEDVNTKFEDVTSKITQDIDGIKASVTKVEGAANITTNSVKRVRYIRDYLNGSNISAENRWVEIQVINNQGENIALEKSIRSNGENPRDLELIVDGEIDSESYGVADSLVDEHGAVIPVYVEIDLGRVRDDIEFIKTWHFFYDNRKFRDTKVEVSEDGEEWVVLFDSSLTGVYTEDNRGLHVPVNLGNTINSLETRIKSAELAIEPDRIYTSIKETLLYKEDMENINGLMNEIKEEAFGAISDLSGSLDDTYKYMEEAFKDGIITASEMKILENNIKNLEKDKTSLKEKCDDLLANPYLKGAVRSELQNSLNDFNTSHTNLVNRIKNVISDSKITETERELLTNDSKLYNTRFARLEKAIQQAIAAIGNEIAKEIGAENQSYIEQTAKKISLQVMGIQTVTGEECIRNGKFVSGLDEWKKESVSASVLEQGYYKYLTLYSSGTKGYRGVTQEFETVNLRKYICSFDICAFRSTNRFYRVEIQSLINDNWVILKEITGQAESIDRNAPQKIEVKLNATSNNTRIFIGGKNAESFDFLITNVSFTTGNLSVSNAEFSVEKDRINSQLSQINKDTEGITEKISQIDQTIDKIGLTVKGIQTVTGEELLLNGKFLRDTEDWEVVGVVTNRSVYNDYIWLSLYNALPTGEKGLYQEVKTEPNRSYVFSMKLSALANNNRFYRVEIQYYTGDRWATLKELNGYSQSIDRKSPTLIQETIIAKNDRTRVFIGGKNGERFDLYITDVSFNTGNTSVSQSDLKLTEDSINLNVKKVVEITDGIKENMSSISQTMDKINLRVQGVQTMTGEELVVNGNFFADTQGWTVNYISMERKELEGISWLNVKGKGLNATGYAMQNINVEPNKKYYFRIKMICQATNKNYNINIKSFNNTTKVWTVIKNYNGSCNNSKPKEPLILSGEVICPTELLRIEIGENGNSGVDVLVTEVSLNTGTILATLSEIELLEGRITTRVEDIAGNLSTLTQDVNGFVLQVKDKGTYNKFLNSAFTNTDYWQIHRYGNASSSSEFYVIKNNAWNFPDNNVNTAVLRGKTAWVGEYGIRQTIQTVPGKKYSITFYASGHRLNKSYITIRGTNSSSVNWNGHYEFLPGGGGSNINNWDYYHFVFTSQRADTTIEIGISDSLNDSYMFIAKPMVTEGELPVEWASSNKEIREGITTIGKDGVRCDFEDGTYAEMGRYGMAYWKNGMARPYKYINYQVVRPSVKNGTQTTIVLPDVFQGKTINTDFNVICTYGDIDSDANARWQIDAIRNIFVRIVSWNSRTRELVVQPCLQKIGIRTEQHWGWDWSTTSSGGTARPGEGTIDIIVLAQM